MTFSRATVALIVSVLALACSASAHAATFVSDSFTGTSGTNLPSHTGETGATWTAHPSNTGTVQLSGSGGIRETNASGIGRYYASGAAATADYKVEADFYTRANYASDTTIRARVVCRYSTSADTGYLGGYDKAIGKWEIHKTVASSSTVLASSSSTTLSASTTYHVELDCVGSSLTLKVGGATVASATDSTITAAGKVGIRLQNSPQGASDGIHIDNLAATDITPCTTTVGTVSALQTAANGAANGDIVCVSAGSYAAATIAGSHTGTVTIQPSPGASVTLARLNVNGNYYRVQGFTVAPGSGGMGVVLAAGVDHVEILHNLFSAGAYQLEFASLDCYRTGSPPCQPEQDAPIDDILIQGNKFSAPTEDAMRINNFNRVDVLENELTGIIESGSHVDGIQTITGGDDLDVERNYFHDNEAQVFFIKDGEVSNLVFHDNLGLRNTTSPQGCLTNWSATDLQTATFTRNTEWAASCGGGFILGYWSGAQSTAVAVNHNVFDAMNLDGQNASGITEDWDIFGNTPWSFTVGSHSTTGQSPTFTNTATDDYRLASNPNGIGVTWRPADYTYGP
jgi:hypothetical protein